MKLVVISQSPFNAVVIECLSHLNHISAITGKISIHEIKGLPQDPTGYRATAITYGKNTFSLLERLRIYLKKMVRIFVSMTYYRRTGRPSDSCSLFLNAK